MRRFRLAVSILALGAVIAAPPLRAAEAPLPKKHKTPGSEGQPVLITADQITHDRDLNTVTATGHVEIDQGGRTLLADHLSYNLKQDVIVATGNVSLTEVSGEVAFADYIELTGDMKEAASRGIRVLMVDDSRVAAATGRRVAGDRSVFDKGVYTACQPCAENPEKAPLWQIKANRVTHDEVAHIVEYEDAWLEIAGVPVAYTPYADHADPTVKRKSGFLPPSALNNNIVGTGVRIPYFQVIDPYQDVTIAPLFTTNEGAMLAATHRWRGTSGETKSTASVVRQPASGVAGKDTVGWHVDALSQFALDDTWRAGWQVQRASDKDYLRTYSFHADKPYLTTHPYAEGFGDRNYAALEGYSFQSLTDVTTQNPTSTALQVKRPIVLPLATYSFVGDPGSRGGFWTFDTHAAAVTREEGTSSRRLNTQTAWNLPYTAPDGEVYKLTTALRADGYNSDHVTARNSGQVNAGRVVPQATLDWRFPFAKVGEHSSQVFTPIVVASASPPGANPSTIPNEDSLDFELDDINIFSPQPFSGYDRVVNGPRVAYGGQYSVVNRGSQAADFLLAQSYQANPDRAFLPGNGLDDTLSDIVGRTQVIPSRNLALGYHFRLNKDDLTLRRSEVDASLGPRPLNLSVSYVFLDKLSPTSQFDAREQVSSTLTARMSRYWSTQFYNVENLGSDAGPLQTGGRLSYEDECLLVTTDAGVKHTTVKTFSAGHYLMLRLVFKTITEIPVDVF